MLEMMVFTSIFLHLTEDRLDDRAIIPVIGMVTLLFGKFMRKPMILLTMSAVAVAYPLLANHTMLWLFFATWTVLGLGVDNTTMLGACYFIAGFHKVNSNWESPQYGCTSRFLARMAREYLGVTMGDEMRFFNEDMMFDDFPKILGRGPWELIAWFMVFVEIACGLVAMFGSPKWRRRSLLFCLHLPTAMISFYDFGSVACCGIVAMCPRKFIPKALPTPKPADKKKGETEKTGEAAEKEKEKTPEQLQQEIVDVEERGDFFKFCLPNVLAAVLLRNNLMAKGFVFLVTVTPLILRVMFPPEHRELVCDKKHTGPNRKIIAGAIILLYGCGPYLGLYTAGGFTMFSNLRVYPNGETNHLLIPHAIQGLQSDLVYITNVKPEGNRVLKKLEKGKVGIKAGKVVPYWHLQLMTIRTRKYLPEFQVEYLTPAQMEDLENAVPSVVEPYGWWQQLLPFQFRQLSKLPICQW